MTDEYSTGLRSTDGSRISTDGTITIDGPLPNITTTVVRENVNDSFILGVHAVMNVEDVEDIAEGLMEKVRQGKYEDIISAMNTLEGVCKNLREIAEKMKAIRSRGEIE